MTGRARATLSRASIACGSVLLSLLCAEAATRAFSHIAPPVDFPDPVVGKTYLPGYAGRVYVDECDCDVFLRFNREGFRGPDRPYDKNGATHRIALIGDSMIASIATEEARTAARLLEAGLSGLDGETRKAATDVAPAADEPERATRWEVMNFGVSGASTAQELVLYGERVKRYAPEIVVLAFFLRNDVIDNSPQLGTSPRVFFDLDAQGALVQLPVVRAREEGDEWLNRHSRFYVWQKLMLARIHGRWGRLDRSRLVYLRTPGTEVTRAWALTDALLRRFRSDVAASNARFLVVALAPAEVVYDDVWADLLARSGADASGFDRDAPEQRLATLCAAAGIPLVSTTAAFRAAAPHASSKLENERLFWEGIGHLNERGNEIAASVIAQALRPYLAVTAGRDDG